MFFSHISSATVCGVFALRFLGGGENRRTNLMIYHLIGDNFTLTSSEFLAQLENVTDLNYAS